MISTARQYRRRRWKQTFGAGAFKYRAKNIRETRGAFGIPSSWEKYNTETL